MKKIELKTVFCSELDKKGKKVAKVCMYTMPLTAFSKKNNFLAAEFKEVRGKVKCTSITISNATKDLVKDLNSKEELSVSLAVKETDGSIILNKIVEYVKKSLIMGVTKEQALTIIHQFTDMIAESATEHGKAMVKQAVK